MDHGFYTNHALQGPESWNKIVVCIIADGREKVHPRVFDLLSALGVYQEGVAKSIVNGRSVHAHLYEVCLLRCCNNSAFSSSSLSIQLFTVHYPAFIESRHGV